MYSKHILIVLTLAITILTQGSLLQNLISPAHVVFGYHAATQKEQRIRSIKCIVNSVSTVRQTVQIEVQFTETDFDIYKNTSLTIFSLLQFTTGTEKSSSPFGSSSGNKAPPIISLI